LFFDPEFGFKADDKLITQIVASLTYEFCDQTNNYNKDPKSIIPHDVVASGIYFVHEGQVDMYHKDNIEPLLLFDPGCYFGDISYIFHAKNQLYYFLRPLPVSPNVKQVLEPYRLYSLQDVYL